MPTARAAAMITAVTSPDVVLELKPPRLVSVFYGLSLVVALVILVRVLTFGAPLAFTVLFVAFVVGIAGYNTGAVLSYARARWDGSLEVRNRYRTRRLDRSEIDRVLLDSVGGFGSNRRIELLLTDGQTLPLVATEIPPFPGLRRHLEEQAAELRRWAGTPAHG